MTETDKERFKAGKRFSSNLNGNIWRIDKVDSLNQELYVTDDFGFSCRVFTNEFDNYFKLLEDLPVGTQLELDAEKCGCGSDKYYASQGTTGPHSDYCSKYKGGKE